MDSGTAYRTLPSKRHLFKLGLTVDPICERCLEEDMGQFLMEPGDYYDAPISRVLQFVRSAALLKD
jgi:hypothetical protein